MVGQFRHAMEKTEKVNEILGKWKAKKTASIWVGRVWVKKKRKSEKGLVSHRTLKIGGKALVGDRYDNRIETGRI